MGMTPPPPPPGGTPPPPPGGQPPGYPPGGQPPPPGYTPYGGVPTGPTTRTNGMAVASLVLGIVGILLCFLFVPWILAIVFGLIAIKQCNADASYTGKGLAVAGLVLGLISAGLVVLVLATGDFTYTFD